MPNALVTRHLDAMLRGPLADPFGFGAQASRCVFDDEGEVLLDETGRDVPRRTRVAIIRTGSITGLVEGSAVTVAGVAYQVRRVLPMEDGLLTRVFVTRPDL